METVKYAHARVEVMVDFAALKVKRMNEICAIVEGKDGLPLDELQALVSVMLGLSHRSTRAYILDLSRVGLLRVDWPGEPSPDESKADAAAMLEALRSPKVYSRKTDRAEPKGL